MWLTLVNIGILEKNRNASVLPYSAFVVGPFPAPQEPGAAAALVVSKTRPEEIQRLVDSANYCLTRLLLNTQMCYIIETVSHILKTIFLGPVIVTQSDR